LLPLLRKMPICLSCEELNVASLARISWVAHDVDRQFRGECIPVDPIADLSRPTAY
jgi:hypothetical protein